MNWLRSNGWLIAFIAATLSLFIAASVVAAQRELTALESLFVQWLVLVVGLAATAFTGYRSVRDATTASTRRHVRSAFRRVTALYSGYTRIGEAIAEQDEALAEEAGPDGRVPASAVRASLGLLDAQLQEQFETLEDALADWRDLSPEGVAEVETELRRRFEP